MLKPIKLKVLIEPDGKRTETASGLYTGAYSTEGALRRGTVVSVGDKVTDVKEGDRVCWSVESGNIVKYEDKEYVLMYITEIIGFINED